MRSLERVLAILESVAVAGATTPSRVASEIGLAPSTVARLMADMSEQKLLDRASPASYTLGERLLLLVEAAGAQRDPLSRVRPVLDRLRDLSLETTTLHVIGGGRRLCLASAESPHLMRRVGQVGEALPLTRSATVAVLLSGLTADARAAHLIDMNLTMEELQEFTAQIEIASEQLWCVVSDTWVPHVTGISAAVQREGRTVAALTIAGPVSRFSEAAALTLQDDLLNAATELSSMRLNAWWS